MSYKMLGKYLSDLNRDFIKHSELKLSEYKLTLNMWRCMMIIEQKKTCNLKDIAKSLNVDNAVVTRNIKKLEELNYIIKVKRNNDNRFFDLCLTDEGLSILKSINNCNDEWYEKVLKNFSEGEYDTLITFMKKLCSNT